MPEIIFTVGHSDLNFMRFISLIQANNINHIIDIRSIPYSRYAPWSNKSRLPDILTPFRIKYTYLGHKLGGKKQAIDPSAKQPRTTPRQVYDEAIQILMGLATRDKLVLFCSEGNPAPCHRQRTIAQTLLASGVKVVHILSNGRLKEAWKEDKTAHQPALI